MTTLLGPNGAGKSTLVLAVGGILRSAAGSVSINGTNLSSCGPSRSGRPASPIVPEGRRLLPELTVEDNLRVATYALDGPTRRAASTTRSSSSRSSRRAGSAIARTLSGGEQQMVVLAQALVSRPKFMLVDELSLGLAPVVVQRLMPALEAAASDGVGVLLIEQFVHVALALAQKAYVIEGGRIHYDGSAQRLRDEPELLQSAYLLRDTAAAGAVPIEKVEIDVAPVEIPIDAPPTATAPSEAAPDASPSEPGSVVEHSVTRRGLRFPGRFCL